jgi:steroid delta-isomerase-like uncharacterized protein
MTGEHKALVRRVYDEVINEEHKAAIDDVFASDVIVHDPFTGVQHGIAAFKQLLAMFDAAFPHHRVEVHHLIAEDDYVTVLHTHLAHHAGPFMGLPPTGKDLRVDGVEVMRLAGGKIIEFWRHDDDAGLLMQLGVLPQPEAVGM